MIGKILNGILSFVITLISWFLSPIDSFITQNMPSLNNGLTAFGNMIDYVIDFIGYVVDLSGLTDIALLLIIGYYSFAIFGSLTVYIVKLAIKWYKALVP